MACLAVTACARKTTVCVTQPTVPNILTIGRPVIAPYSAHCNGNNVYIFLFWELRGLSPNFHILVSVSVLYIPRIGPHISSNRKGRPIVEIYNSLTDTWMWKLGLKPRYSFSGNICFQFSAFCLCSECKLHTIETRS